MALTTLADVKIMLGIPSSNTTQDSLLNLLITEVSYLIQNSCQRQFGQANYSEYYQGNGNQYFPLNERPCILFSQTGNLTNGSPVITGLQSTSNMITGMPVVGTNPAASLSGSTPAITPNTSILSIDSSTQIHLSTNANISNSQTLFFGLEIFLDDGSYWGTAISNSYTPFQSNTQLQPGQDFSLDIDQPGGIFSNSGLIYSIQGWWDKPFTYTPGRISPYLGPSNGNILVNYTAGYPVIPVDVELACNLMIAKVMNTRIYGEALVSERDEVYSYNLKSSAKMGLFSNEVNSILARYRNIGVG